MAAPLAGMTLAQLGAEVIRIDPIGGAADTGRWPLTDDGHSIYWTGLNKGKRSATVDLRSREGQRAVADLIAGDPAGGILLTNMSGRDWLDHDTLAARRPDLIHLEIRGRADGSAAVDYTGVPPAAVRCGRDCAGRRRPSVVRARDSRRCRAGAAS